MLVKNGCGKSKNQRSKDRIVIYLSDFVSRNNAGAGACTGS